MTTAPPRNSPWGTGKKVPPLGLSYLAATLEKEGFDVEILDNYLLEKPIDYIKQRVSDINPKMVGITCSSVTYQQSIETAKAIKEIHPSCKVVMGGPHPSCMPESMLTHPEIDYVVLGEGEQALVELSKSILKENTKNVKNVPNLAYRENGKIVKTPLRFIDNLDQVPYAARHLLPIHLYDRTIEFLEVTPVDTMNIIRGCPYECIWCNVNQIFGKKARSFSPQRVIGEVNYLVSEYGTKGIYFVGDLFTLYKDKTEKICELIKKYKLDIEWVCDTRVDLVSRELLRTMRDAGCKTIWFGVESGSPKILKKIKRGFNFQQVEKAFRLCKQERINTACSFMLGIPGETLRDMEATLKFAKKLNPDWCQFNIIIAYPGCTLYEEIIRENLYDRIEDFMAYIKTEHFDYKMLLKVQKRFHRSFNRTPKRMFKRAFEKLNVKFVSTLLQL
jgi:radical SAM superfamily enzyme YgiQ (UPF0313 family)